MPAARHLPLLRYGSPLEHYLVCGLESDPRHLPGCNRDDLPVTRDGLGPTRVNIRQLRGQPYLIEVRPGVGRLETVADPGDEGVEVANKGYLAPGHVDGEGQAGCPRERRLVKVSNSEEPAISGALSSYFEQLDDRIGSSPS